MRGEVSELVIEVSDRGLGLPRDAARNPQQQPLSSRNGLGVGLESVRRLMDDLEIQSFPKRGTRLVARKRFKP
jgi:anti-sigma regulatory factor (Ser/Thr protein kinase)